MQVNGNWNDKKFMKTRAHARIWPQILVRRENGWGKESNWTTNQLADLLVVFMMIYLIASFTRLAYKMIMTPSGVYKKKVNIHIYVNIISQPQTPLVLSQTSDFFLNRP